MKDTCGVERVVDGTIVLLPVRVGANATGIFDFKVKGRGVTDGKTVEHEAIGATTMHRRVMSMVRCRLGERRSPLPNRLVC